MTVFLRLRTFFFRSFLGGAAIGAALLMPGGAMPALAQLGPPKATVEGKVQDNLLQEARRPNITAAVGDTEVDIVAQVTDSLLNRIRELRGTVINSFPADYAIRARIPLSAVPQLAAHPDVRFVRQAVRPRHNQAGGSPPLLAGGAAHKADAARDQFQVKGKGVKVCVISDSMDDNQNALQKARSDKVLPPEPQLKPYPGQAGTGSGEGLAMLEIVHQIAPEADLVFATGQPSASQMAQNIRDLAKDGCRVIVDDVTYLDEPPFQDGPITQAINDNAGRVLFISSAANSGNQKHGTSGTWEGDFEDGGTDSRYPGYKVHKFPNGKTYASVTKETYRIGLYWNDPWLNSTNDYSLVVTDAQDALRVRFDAHFNPLHLVSGSGTSYFAKNDKILILKKDGADDRYLRLDANRGQIDPGTGGSTFGHNGAQNVLSVAAVKVPDPLRPFGGGTGVAVRDYSSDGPRRLFYAPDGTRLPPGELLFKRGGGRVMDKPDIAAADGVRTTWVPDKTSPNKTIFDGTSAAAPHVAGIAALVMAYNPALTPDEVKLVLKASALDIEAAGYDWNSGYGLVMADRALAAAFALPARRDDLFNRGICCTPWTPDELGNSVTRWKLDTVDGRKAVSVRVMSSQNLSDDQVRLLLKVAEPDGLTWPPTQYGKNPKTDLARDIAGSMNGSLPGTWYDRLGPGFKAYASAVRRMIVLDNNGSVRTYGFAEFDLRGREMRLPPDVLNVVAVGIGLTSFYALKQDGSLLQWAGNFN